MKRLQYIILLLLFSMGFPLPSVADESGPDQIFVFGDSLSDVGNGAIATGAPFPAPFFNNRVSNGPVALDVMAAEFGLTLTPSLAGGNNYAVAGARAGGMAMVDLGFQLQSFIATHPAGAPTDALYVIMIGGNDVRDARDEFSPVAAAEMLRNGVNGIAGALQTLIDYGARNIMVVNAPDLGNIPETRMIAAELGDWFKTAATWKSVRFNAQLYWKVRQIEWRNRMHIKQFNLFGTTNEFLQDAETYQFSNTTDACFNPYVEPFVFHPVCDFNTFAFFDPIHPTAKLHALVGMRMAEKVEHKKHGQRYYALNH